MNTKSFDKIKYQSIIFSDDAKRLDLLSITTEKSGTACVLNVYRNMLFEPIGSVIEKYFQYFSYDLQINYSAYDDSFSFSNLKGDSDFYLIWIDYRRYLIEKTNDEVVEWLIDRLLVLRKLTARPIFINDYFLVDKRQKGFNALLKEKLATFSHIRLLEINNILSCFPTRKVFDESMEKEVGFSLTNFSCLKLAKQLSLKYFGAALFRPIKAIVFDLDNTLYKGVLLEDGILGVRLNDEFKRLQTLIFEFSKKGIYVCLCSKNEPGDVAKLFAERKDFQLSLSDFSAVKINWESKSSNIIKIASELNISPDALLFVDDNPGELLEVVTHISDISIIHASSPLEVRTILSHYPGLAINSTSETDLLRVRDQMANKDRAELADSSVSMTEYYRKLGIKLTIYGNHSEHIKRASELSKKTNQFNTAYARLTEVDIEKYICNQKGGVITVALEDILSKSGVIASFCYRVESDVLNVDEITISCRALGRAIEVIVILECIKYIKKTTSFSSVCIYFEKKARNLPAEKVLAELSSRIIENRYLISNSELDMLISRYLATFPCKVLQL